VKPSWIAFVGPTISSTEAKKFGCEARPPARQGDVWRALVERPRALVLIDGVFESQPSVWHHELRAALASGVAVFGASSMGALRSAELWREGMVGVGAIFRSFRDGKRIDDADVALLHADAEHHFKALTVPQVNVDHALALARKQKVLSAAQVRQVAGASAATHYQQRSWPELVSVLPQPVRGRFQQWLARTDVDLKAADARECLAAAADWIASGAPAAAVGPCAASSHVRRRRLVDAVPGALERAQSAPDAEALADAGTRRRLLAGWARSMGVQADAAKVTARMNGVPKEGVAADEAFRLAEDLVLEEELLGSPERWLADGPTRLEGLADEAKLLGRWKK
jgi:hypothetical protein